MSSSEAQFTAETGNRGEFVRQANRFTGRPEPERGRYQLVVSLACPWAHRAIIVRRLLGLEDALGLSVVDPIRDERGWRFTNHPDGRDPATGLAFLADAYRASDPTYAGRVTVPAIIDLTTGHVVTNDYPQITLDLSTRWTALHRAGAPDLYPEHLRAEIDAINADVFRDVNNGVYRCGFATSQDAYEEAFDALFARLDLLEKRLGGQRFLVGESITEADIRLFTTLVRFDAVYHGHFKTNLRKLTEYPVLWAYARDLFQTEGFGDTVDFDHIKRHYYVTHNAINPTGIVPKGPDPTLWHTPHDRG
ncbi:glutathione S-transferase family protein [Embleya sp. MST-111070]|uniref:glutathione S-transferase family protein n=1 Tax=Embleya sp. MST-111070 TaxID=3398231 RepID=UPI003F736988